MAETRPLEKNWQAQVENHLAVMKDVKSETAHLTAGSAEHAHLLATHEGVCHAFNYYMEIYFGSAQGFGDFLRADAEKKLQDVGMSHEILNVFDGWKISGDSVPEIAQNAGKLYEKVYKAVVDGASHLKAFPAPAFRLH